jgi:hypothetical protein
MQGQLDSLRQETDILAHVVLQLLQLQLTTPEEQKTIAQNMGARTSSTNEGDVQNAPLEQLLAAALRGSPCTMGLMELCGHKYGGFRGDKPALIDGLMEGLLREEDWMDIKKSEWARWNRGGRMQFLEGAGKTMLILITLNSKPCVTLSQCYDSCCAY